MICERKTAFLQYAQTHSEYCSLPSNLATQKKSWCVFKDDLKWCLIQFLIVGLDVMMVQWGQCRLPWAIKVYHVCFCLRFNKNLKPCSHIKACRCLICDIPYLNHDGKLHFTVSVYMQYLLDWNNYDVLNGTI